MKYFILLFFVVSIIEVKAQHPDIELKTLDQQWVSIDGLKGETLTVVDFWATWCKPCVTALPKLAEIHREFQEQGVEFIGINTDGPRNIAKVKPLVKTLGINYPILLDTDNELVNEYNVTAFPTLFIFDRKGELAFTHEGFVKGDEKIIREEISKLLESL